MARIASVEDKRVNLIHLTKNGEKVLSEAGPVLLLIIRELQEGIAQEDQKVVIAVMKQIQQNIEKHIDSCSNNN